MPVSWGAVTRTYGCRQVAGETSGFSPNPCLQVAGETSRFPRTPSTGPLRGQGADAPPPGFPGPLPVVRYANKALRASQIREHGEDAAVVADVGRQAQLREDARDVLLDRALRD